MNTNKYIHAFEDGDGKNKILLGGKGAGLCEMTQIGLNVPPGLHRDHRACLAYLESNKLPGRSDGRNQDSHGGAGEEDRQGFRRQQEPLADFGALRFGHVHAGDDGHHTQSRPQ